jgi:putative inorganic carbon (hco3(-)) transporter
VNGVLVRFNPEANLAAAGALALGSGIGLALAGAVTDRLPLGLVGALLAVTAFVLLVALGTLDEVGLVLLTLPLPALYSDASVRVTITAPLTAAAVLGWYLRRGIAAGQVPLGSLPIRSGMTLLAALVVATVFAAAPASAARELINDLSIAAFLIIALDAFADGQARRDRLVRTVVVVAGCAGLWGALESLALVPAPFPQSGSAYARAAGGFGQPNGLGLFLALAAPFAWHLRKHASTYAERVVATAALAAIVAGLLGSFSRGAWLAVVLGASVLFLSGNARAVWRIWGAVLVGALVVDVLSGGAIRLAFARTVGDWLVEQRAGLALAGIAMFLDHPFVGVGPGGFGALIDEYGPRILGLWDYLPTPHNVYIQFAAEAGIVALIAYVVFLAGVLRVHVRAIRSTTLRLGPDAAEAHLRAAAAWSVATGALAGLALTPFAHGTAQLFVLAIAIGCAGEGA